MFHDVNLTKFMQKVDMLGLWETRLTDDVCNVYSLHGFTDYLNKET